MNPAKRRKIGHVFRELPLDIIGEILTFTERSVWRICRLVRHSWNCLILRDASVGSCIERSKILLLNTVRQAKESLNYREYCDGYFETLRNVNRHLLAVDLRNFLRVHGASQLVIDDLRYAWFNDDNHDFRIWATIVEGLVCVFHNSHTVDLHSISYKDMSVIEDVKCREYAYMEQRPRRPMPTEGTIMLLKMFFVKKWNEYHKN